VQIEQLQYLVEVDKTGSISAAAQNLHVSQSAISKSILRLEHDLGLTLFTRSRTGIIPTSPGEQLIRKANEVISKLQEFSDIVDELSAMANRKIKLETVPMFMLILSQSLELLMNENPHTEIDITEKSSKEIIQDVRQNTIDIGFVVLNSEVKNDSELDYQVLMEATTYVCVNKNSPLAGKEYLTPEDVIDQRIVIYNGSIKEWFSHYFDKHHPITYSIITNNIETIKGAVARGSAISFLSELTVKNHAFLESGDIVAIPLLLRGSEVKMQIARVKLKKSAFSKTSKELLKHLKKQIDSTTSQVNENAFSEQKMETQHDKGEA
jgi:LysR family transcriptional activator of glutamate synthase operon